VASVVADESRRPGMVRVFAALDSNDIGAEIRQEPGTKRTGEHVGEIQNSDPCERSGCSWVNGHRHEVILG
jgi:hypothetical protein